MINSLSIIFPYYNEACRLKKSLFKINSFLKKKKFKELEIIFVDDGSTDNSNKLIQEFILKKKIIYKKNHFKILNLKRNFGKGFAIKQGVKYANNDWVLTSDIDHSVSLNEIILWGERCYLTKNYGVYFGSRLARGSIVKKQKIRNLLGYLLRIISTILFGSSIMDTQCGFKLYKKKIAKKIFSKLITKGFSHDVEIVNICLKFNYKIKELPVKWTHMSGGKLNIIYDPLIMFIEIIKIYFSIKNKLPMLKSTF